MTARSLSRWLLAAVVSIVALMPLGSVNAQDDEEVENLISNPSFEGPFSAWGGIPEFQIAPMWNPWWVQQTDQDPPEINRRPEYKPADAHSFPGRVNSGNYAQQYFTFYGTHIAGLYQRVAVPEGAQLRFSIYVQAWSCGLASGCPDATSHNPSNMNARIGIDPQGGTDPFAPEVVWSNAINPLDAYYLLAVEAVAEGPMVTVYTYSAPDIPALNLDMYWDDASLVVVTGSRPSSSRPTPRPASTRASDAAAASSQPTSPDQSGPSPSPTTSLEPPLPTQPAQPDGSVIHVVQRGETLGGIARAYGVSVEELMHLNGLTSYLIFAGNELLIRQAPTSTPTPTARPTRMSTPAVEPEDEQPEDDSAGQLCVTTFDDADGDGLQGEDEGPLPGTVISLGGEAGETYTTGDQTDAYCFEDLPPGEYDVSVEPPEGYALAADPDQQVMLEAGGQVETYFALRLSDEEASPREPASGSGQNNSSALPLRVGALLVMALAGGALAFFVVYRASDRNSAE